MAKREAILSKIAKKWVYSFNSSGKRYGLESIVIIALTTEPLKLVQCASRIHELQMLMFSLCKQSVVNNFV